MKKQKRLHKYVLMFPHANGNTSHSWAGLSQSTQDQIDEEVRLGFCYPTNLVFRSGTPDGVIRAAIRIGADHKLVEFTKEDTLALWRFFDKQQLLVISAVGPELWRHPLNEEDKQ